ncbi:hypothetical protein SAMN02982929_04256 [Saccharopolyspora kobensis]|uniref:Uncharacterized protein n=1 Tax=Saccharopolyspora kobensis TaxID=146035 RepID=A0A1H6DFD5_9PSEU|nr:hypothetical protein SAMN02982929_04256 [Saccharopolyspora kobensis]SFE30947.1 hypothetical protein SAMN05216506_110173 [Saccharopolyspora kobensis]
MRYSSAQRCTACDHRAILVAATADRLVAESGRALVSYDCPEGNGVHVCNPDFERTGSRRA